ncbi:MBL fold metallo-hydrolase [Paenibacillus apiarius]|uniref:MBL fold metallo-hydrolase n=1 Tax=Paenibacillus apiarius TaxID=46240 RepID=UPI001982613C|nr:MBL fold metallo-hydrolase [Paenibacillus apiarius]MBN3526381.1 MBL fold metallo-hydrolase [Paenibacillus apiarius]
MNGSHKVYTLKLCFNHFINYSYIILDEASRQAVIVDPAWEMDKICNTIDRLDAVLVGVLLTHSHYDHTNLAEQIAKKYHANVYMSSKEIDYYHFICSKLLPLHDEEILSLGDTAIKCLYTPGHTAGSASFLVDGSLFSGDFIFIEGCGICSSEGASAEDMFLSIQKIKSMIPLDTRIYPGHSFGKSPGYPLNYLLEHNIYFHIKNKDRFVEFRMRRNQKGIFNFK